MCGAVQRHPLARLAGHDDALISRGMVVDEEDLARFADGQVGGFAGARGERLDRLTADADQHPAPVVLTRQPPDGRSEHIVLPPVGIGQEAAALQRIGQAEDAARVDAQDLGQVRQRHWLRPTAPPLPGPTAPVPRFAPSGVSIGRSRLRQRSAAGPLFYSFLALARRDALACAPRAARPLFGRHFACSPCSA